VERREKLAWLALDGLLFPESIFQHEMNRRESSLVKSLVIYHTHVRLREYKYFPHVYRCGYEETRLTDAFLSRSCSRGKGEERAIMQLDDPQSMQNCRTARADIIILALRRLSHVELTLSAKRAKPGVGAGEVRPVPRV